LGGIKDYTYQNIIFVHDFVYIFLILVFLIIVGYFEIILFDYIKDRYKSYFLIFTKKEKKKFFFKIHKKKKKTDTRRIINHFGVRLVVIRERMQKNYALYLKNILNKVHNLILEVI